MSEYIEIDAEWGEEGKILFTTNLKLTAAGQPEFYVSMDEMEEGSPVAQALAAVEGIDTLWMDGGMLTVTSLTDADWHAIIADVKAALREFFL
jgi:hypothetical protein